MASEPPMDFRMAATASACARMFSPVSWVSLAIRGSANARARASAFGWSGRLSAVAVTMEAFAPWEAVGPPGPTTLLFMKLQSNGCAASAQQKIRHGGELVGGDQRGGMSHAFKFHHAGMRPALRHGLG